ncbi:MAG TPA: hypothetical protein VGB71_03265 [Flavisolibacter sp.]
MAYGLNTTYNIAPMETSSYFIEYLYNGRNELAEIKPCCGDDNSYYYDVFIKNQYQFTVTPVFDEKTGLDWRISLKNADKQVDQEVVNLIGMEIEKHMF